MSASRSDAGNLKKLLDLREFAPESTDLLKGACGYIGDDGSLRSADADSDLKEASYIAGHDDDQRETPGSSSAGKMGRSPP